MTHTPTAAPDTPGRRPHVIGLDVAIGTTGVAGCGWAEAIHADQPGLHARMQHQITVIKDYIRHVDFVVLEGAAFSHAKRQGADQLSAMRWMVRLELWKRGIPYAVCPPDNRTVYATGKARWKGCTPTQVKAKVREAVADRYGVEVDGRWRYDKADAYVLMAAGMHHLGHPLAPVPATHSRALDGIQWPTSEGVPQ